MSQQQQQTDMMKPKKVAMVKNGGKSVVKASMKASGKAAGVGAMKPKLPKGSKIAGGGIGQKMVGAINKPLMKGMKKSPAKMGMGSSRMPSKAMVEKSVRKTMGY